MPRLLGGTTGERMELAAYYADFQWHYARASEFWKLERGQAYAEPGDASWRAFDRGDWEEAMRLLDERRSDLARYFWDNAARGLATRRVRVVTLPPSGYLQWELHLLRVRDKLGGLVRVLPDHVVADLEDQEPLPDICTFDDDVMYQAVYDAQGVLDHALRYTSPALVTRCRDVIAGLYQEGEPIGGFFQREIAPLPPPRPAAQAIPHDYLSQAGRPQPIRS